MNKIALVTDSSCDLTMEQLKENNIEFVPLRINYADREYRDRIDITPDEVYNRLHEEIPKTSMPTPGDLIEKINSLKEQGYTHILAITISSGLSGTYDMFKMVAEDISDVVIEVIDSRTLSMVLGLIVLEASRLIKSNATFDEIIRKINAMKFKSKGFYVLDTMEYLRKGGRIGLVASTLGTLLNIKPVISVNNEGKYFTYSKTRGKAQATASMVDALKKQLESTKTNVAVLQGMAQEEANLLYEKIKNMKNINSLCISAISPALVVHTGPGLLGLAFCPAE
jgi:DegV family protein with EDD domain